MAFAFPSLRVQLLAWLLIPAILLFGIAAFTCVHIAFQLTEKAYDEGLADMTRVLASRMRMEKGQWRLDLPPEALAVLRDDPIDKIYLKVSDENGGLIYGDTMLPSPTEKGDGLILSNENVAGSGLRLASIRLKGEGTNSALVQVAETLVGREQILTSIISRLILPGVLMLLGVAASVFYGVQRGLRGLTVLSEAVAQRSLRDLSKIDEQAAPKEIKPFVAGINNLLGRIERDVDAQRRFLSNAAHRLRTPIAGLKIQTELAVRDAKDELSKNALTQVRFGLDRVTRLVKQLLALARADPSSMDFG